MRFVFKSLLLILARLPHPLLLCLLLLVCILVWLWLRLLLRLLIRLLLRFMLLFLLLFLLLFSILRMPKGTRVIVNSRLVVFKCALT